MEMDRGEPLVVKYGPHDRQTIGIYREISNESLCHDFVFFIHGGAWRDPTNSFKDGTRLLNSLSKIFTKDNGSETGLIGVSLDYRLSPQVLHPVHLQDVALGLDYINQNYKVKRAIIVGHSVGATIALQLFKEWNSWSDSVKAILSKVRVIVGSEGIYDIRALLRDDPSYESFIREALGQNTSYKDWDELSPLSETRIDPGNEPPRLNFSGRLVIVHSMEDELLSYKIQPEIAKRLLRSSEIEVDVKYIANGLHDDVYKGEKLVTIVSEECCNSFS